MSASSFDAQALLAKAQQPAEESMRLHKLYHGKLETGLKVPVRGFEDFSYWYSPGVAAPCKAIQADPEQAYTLTGKANTIAVISDGTRVLGLGDIGPLAALPVMEGKCLLFKYLGGVDAVPLTLDTKDPQRFIETVLLLQPAFGGINLEDISQPKCFHILDELRQRADIPIWHDDQQGTATVTLAGLMNALKVVGKCKEDVRMAFIGAGAAGIACCRLIFSWGVNPAKATIVDVNGILGAHRKDYEDNQPAFAEHWKLCQMTNAEGRRGGIAEALDGADVVISYSQPGPGVLQADWIKGMAKDAIVFACANPTPEIYPWEAKAAGAVVVATGRSDFPNQVNNSLCFPAIFRGVLDVRAKTITDEMCFAAAQALADATGDLLSTDNLLPKMTQLEIFPIQAAAVALKAQQQGLAQVNMDEETLMNNATAMIQRAQAVTQSLMAQGFIPPA